MFAFPKTARIRELLQVACLVAVGGCVPVLLAVVVAVGCVGFRWVLCLGGVVLFGLRLVWFCGWGFVGGLLLLLCCLVAALSVGLVRGRGDVRGFFDSSSPLTFVKTVIADILNFLLVG